MPERNQTFNKTPAWARCSTEEILDAMYPQWDVLQHSMDLPRHGEKEPALAIVDGE